MKDAPRPQVTLVRALPELARFGRFTLVGAAGLAVQLAVLAFGLDALSMHYLAATALAVGAAVLHNFLWHCGWTWRDRALPVSAVPTAFARFVLANGVVSLGCSLLGMRGLVGAVGVPPLAAGLAATAAGGAINYLLANRLVFRRLSTQAGQAGSERLGGDLRAEIGPSSAGGGPSPGRRSSDPAGTCVPEVGPSGTARPVFP